jgi:hypothetical protein
MHVGHQVTYLEIFIMPYLLRCLFQAAYPTDPMLCKTTYDVFICKSPWQWLTRGRRTHSIPKRLHRKKKPSVHLQTELTVKAKLRTYLVSVVVSAFKAGCRVEGWLRELLTFHCLRELPSFPGPNFTALSSAIDRTRAVHFNSDSYPIGIDTHATRCMANAPHRFKDLKLGDVHEAKDNYLRPKGTRISQDDEFYYMHWGQAKNQKLIPYNPLTNVPILYTATFSRTYRALATTLQAMEAPFF